jgi:2-desacetyl-2-hydroxyethyl bacteriochlorophyllide A dehydrogenase
MRNVGIEFPAQGQMAFYDLGAPPEIGPGQALLETLYSGITNGTERHGLMGDHGYGSSYPGRHGYQHVCRVAAAGEGVDSLRVGDVLFLGLYVGHRGWHVVNAIPQAPLSVVLPDDVDHGARALLGVAGVALRAIRRTRVRAAQKVLVMGLGPIGIFGAQCAKAVGAHVTAADLVDARLMAARETGMHRVVDMRGDDPWQRIAEGAPYDVIFDGSGYERLFFDIAERGLLAHSGAIAAIAVRGQAAFPWSMLHGTEASIEVSCHFSVEELTCLLHFLRTGLLQIEPIISHRVPITDAPAIYAAMRDDPRSLYGVVFDWSQADA